MSDMQIFSNVLDLDNIRIHHECLCRIGKSHPRGGISTMDNPTTPVCLSDPKTFKIAVKLNLNIASNIKCKIKI